MRTALPWILVALFAGLWIGSIVLVEKEPMPRSSQGVPDVSADGSDELAELRSAVNELRKEVRSLREEHVDRRMPVLQASNTKRASASHSATPRSESFKKREEKARVNRARRQRDVEAAAIRKKWNDDIRSLKDASAREFALREMRAAFDGENDVRRLAALRLARWIGNVEFDRADWRGAILPHARNGDPEVQIAALIALAYVQPEHADLDLWSEVIKHADRENGEEVAHAIVRASGGIIRGTTADAVLHLLRDGTNTKKAFVIRGLQGGREWDEAVEARLIEIARNAPARDYDSVYYFHFITSRLDPKSDEVIELMLEKIEEGKSEMAAIMRGFRIGLDDRQAELVADKLLGYAENAGTSHKLKAIADGLKNVVRPQHIPRLEALAKGDNVSVYAQRALNGAIDAAQRRR